MILHSSDYCLIHIFYLFAALKTKYLCEGGHDKEIEKVLTQLSAGFALSAAEDGRTCFACERQSVRSAQRKRQKDWGPKSIYALRSRTQPTSQVCMGQSQSPHWTRTSTYVSAGSADAGRQGCAQVSIRSSVRMQNQLQVVRECTVLVFRLHLHLPFLFLLVIFRSFVTATLSVRSNGSTSSARQQNFTTIYFTLNRLTISSMCNSAQLLMLLRVCTLNSCALFRTFASQLQQLRSFSIVFICACLLTVLSCCWPQQQQQQ